MNKKKLIAAVIVLAVLGIGLLCWQSVVLPLFPSLRPGIEKLHNVDRAQQLIWSPNGKYLAGLIRMEPLDLPCFGCEEPHSEIFIVELSTMQRRTVIWSKFGQKSMGSISWLPDSEHIAYRDSREWGKGEIRIIGVDGRNDVQFMAGTGAPLWHPNLPIIAMNDIVGKPGQWYPTIDILDLASMETKQVFQGTAPVSQLSSLSWSADGKTLAFSYGKIGPDAQPEPNIYFLDLETKQLTQFTDDGHEYWGVSFSPAGKLIALERGDDSRIVIRDLAKNCEVELPFLFGFSASWSPDGQKLAVVDGNSAYLVDLTEFLGPAFRETGSICK